MNATSEIVEISLGEIHPASYNPTRRKEVSYCKDLIESIDEVGQVMPILVTKIADGYQIVDGVRRWTACRHLNMESMRCIVIGQEAAPAIYAAVTWASKRLNGKDALAVYLAEPRAIPESLADNLSRWNRRTLQFAVDHGGSYGTLKQAISVAKYCGADKDKALKWLLGKEMTLQARLAMASKIEPEFLLNVIESNGSLRRAWEAV